MVQMNAVAGALGFVPATDPTAYTNQVTLTEQTTAAITALKSTATLISTFATAITIIPGGDPVFVQKIKDLDAKAKAAVANTAGKAPAQIAKDTAELTSGLSSLQIQQAAAPVQKTEIQRTQDALDTITTRISELQRKNVAANLIQPYIDLQTKTQGHISDLIALDIQKQQQEQQGQQGQQGQQEEQANTAEAFTSGSAPSLDPIADLASLDAATRNAIDSDTSAFGTFRKILSYGATSIYYILLVVSLWIGGTATSNAFNKKSLPVKIWYFIYGAILFQITIPIYGIFFTPSWHAWLIPLIDRTSSMNPVIKSLFGQYVVGAKQTGGSQGNAPDAPDAAAAPAAAAAPDSGPKAIGKTLIDNKHALRMLSIGTYILFNVFYTTIQYLY